MNNLSSKVIVSSLVVLFTFVACGGATPTDLEYLDSQVAGSGEGEVQSQVCWVIQEMDGDVSSWGEVDTQSDVIRVGYEPGWFGGRDFRGILSFDTSSVPPEAEILGVWMYLGIHAEQREELPDDWSGYASQNLYIDIAPPFGFGGSPFVQSHEVTGFDYYAAPMARTSWVQDPVVGALHLYNRDINPSEIIQHINRNGVTQVRLGFMTNPKGYLMKFQSGEVESNGPEEPYPQPFLYVIWQ